MRFERLNNGVGHKAVVKLDEILDGGEADIRVIPVWTPLAADTKLKH
jgi:hypothetical protein